MDTPPLHILVAADGLFGDALAALIGGTGNICIGRVRDGCEVARQSGRLRPDVIALDAALPRLSCGSLQCEPAVAPPILFLASSLNATAGLLAAGIRARGVIAKSAGSSTFLSAAGALARGDCWVGEAVVPDLEQAVCPPSATGAAPRLFGLTPREFDILAAVAAACTNKDIAVRYAISVTTVKHHLTTVFRKVGVTSRLELACLNLEGKHPRPDASDLHTSLGFTGSNQGRQSDTGKSQQPSAA